MIWIGKQVALAIHEEQLAEHGGAAGVRDEGALESALSRPRNLETYGDPPPDIADLAAAYALGIAGNHPFVDGNKRTSLVVAGTFLVMNGRRLAPGPAVVEIWLKLASGAMTETDLANWLRARI